MKAVQTILDAVAILTAGVLAFWLRFYSGLIPVNRGLPSSSQPYIASALISTVVMLLILHAMKTYDSRSLARVLVATLVGLAVLFLGVSAVQTYPPLSRLVQLLFAVVVTSLLLVTRVMSARLFRESLKR